MGDGAGPEADGFTVMPDGVGNAARRIQGSCQIAVEIGLIRQLGKCLADEVDRDLRPAEMIRHHAEQIERVGLTGPLLQNLAINGFGLRQIAGLMQLKGVFEGGAKFVKATPGNFYDHYTNC